MQTESIIDALVQALVDVSDYLAQRARELTDSRPGVTAQWRVDFRKYSDDEPRIECFLDISDSTMSRAWWIDITRRGVGWMVERRIVGLDEDGLESTLASFPSAFMGSSEELAAVLPALMDETLNPSP